jgi:branched-chain amino acid transport system permease protein
VEYIIAVLTFTGITVIGVLGSYLVTGLTGLFSFGQAAFFSVGAYTSAMLVKNLNVPFLLAVSVCVGIIFPWSPLALAKRSLRC